MRCAGGKRKLAKASTERTTYGAFERFLYFFLIPMLYSSVLVSILFLVFNSDVRDSFLESLNKIPVIREIVPDPEVEEEVTDVIMSPEVVQIQKEAKQQTEAIQAELASAVEAIREKEAEIDSLKEQIAQLESEQDDKKLSEEEYEQQIQNLAKMYADMTPSKAAPIIEELLPSEQVLILSRMSQASRTAILQRMAPESAAQATRGLKDLGMAEDEKIAALQERVKELESQLAGQVDALTVEQLADTFAAMAPASAAAVLLEMMKINENEVISVLRAMSSTERSAILTAFTDEDSSIAARVSSMLAE